MSTFTLITQHGEGRKVRRRRFSTYEEAEAFARANTPETDWSMVPNVDEKYGEHPNYSRGFFMDRVNRYAALLVRTDPLHD